MSTKTYRNRGSYGEVYTFTQNEQIYAVKRSKKNEGTYEAWLKEIKISRIRHPNIVEIYDAVQDSDAFYLKMEFIRGNDLFEHLKSRKYKPLNENEVFPIIEQIINALKFLHSFRCFHLDLKMENVMIDSSNRIKLIDFGFSEFDIFNLEQMQEDTLDQQKDHNWDIVSTLKGSPEYFTPEMIMRSHYRNDTSPQLQMVELHGSKIDIWCLGVIIYILTTGLYPFDADQLYETVIQKGTIPPIDYRNLSEPLKNLLQCIFTIYYHERFTLQQIENHPWYKQQLRNKRM